jgi:pyruvate,orthophosphate dikinase
MADVILAGDEAGRRAALEHLLPLQQSDFQGLFEAMEGLPVTIRLLDPPLHEFLPSVHEVERDVERARMEVSDDLAALERVLERVRALEEANPMLGTRGVRLGIVHPEIYAMQARAIAMAMRAFYETWRGWPAVEVMIPLVAYESELTLAAGLVERVMGEYELTRGEQYLIGTMIELPRACFIADHISPNADFFSFGTNDLTQTALGFSRDDIEGKILDRYIDTGILDRSPFETIDSPGVGQMLRMGAWLGRQGNHGLKLGICGEHGGDPDSIDFFHHSGLDYVSCSPYRVPIARVAAAQAATAAS